MRHDKEAFAQEAIASAEIGRTIGDYLRILYFSSYADVLPLSISEIKDAFDPFTGSFISKIPATVAILRFSLKAASLFRGQKSDKGLELVTNGSQRLFDAIRFTSGKDSLLKKQFEKERHGWNLYYDIFDAVEQAIQNQDPVALQLQQKAQSINSNLNAESKLSSWFQLAIDRLEQSSESQLPEIAAWRQTYSKKGPYMRYSEFRGPGAG